MANSSQSTMCVPRRYQCGDCRETASTAEDLTAHMEQHDHCNMACFECYIAQESEGRCLFTRKPSESVEGTDDSAGCLDTAEDPMHGVNMSWLGGVEMHTRDSFDEASPAEMPHVGIIGKYWPMSTLAIPFSQKRRVDDGDGNGDGEERSGALEVTQWECPACGRGELGHAFGGAAVGQSGAPMTFKALRVSFRTKAHWIAHVLMYHPRSPEAASIVSRRREFARALRSAWWLVGQRSMSPLLDDTDRLGTAAELLPIAVGFVRAEVAALIRRRQHAEDDPVQALGVMSCLAFELPSIAPWCGARCERRVDGRGQTAAGQQPPARLALQCVVCCHLSRTLKKFVDHQIATGHMLPIHVETGEPIAPTRGAVEAILARDPHAQILGTFIDPRKCIVAVDLTDPSQFEQWSKSSTTVPQATTDKDRRTDGGVLVYQCPNVECRLTFASSDEFVSHLRETSHGHLIVSRGLLSPSVGLGQAGAEAPSAGAQAPPPLCVALWTAKTEVESLASMRAPGDEGSWWQPRPRHIDEFLRWFSADDALSWKSPAACFVRCPRCRMLVACQKESQRGGGIGAFSTVGQPPSWEARHAQECRLRVAVLEKRRPGSNVATVDDLSTLPEVTSLSTTTYPFPRLVALPENFLAAAKLA